VHVTNITEIFLLLKFSKNLIFILNARLWFTIGMGYVMFAGNLGITGILAFFAGHIFSDLAWYSFVSLWSSVWREICKSQDHKNHSPFVQYIP